MPPASTLLPLSSSSSSSRSPATADDRPLPYSKDDKGGRKPRHLVPLPRSRYVTLVLAFSALCFLFGISGLGFAAYAFLRPPRMVPVFRCGRAEDTFRTFRAKSLATAEDVGLVAPRPKLLGVVGVQTGFSSAGRRAALRSTWFPSDPDAIQRLEQSTGLAFRFVIGRTKDVKKMAALKKEEDKYHDFLLIDVEESIRLPYKTLAFFRAVYALFEADFYVKADDDIYLRPDRLSTLLAKERSHPLTYIGCMKNGPVVTDPKMKWYESSSHLIGSEYFLHAYDPIYALSAEVVASLSSTRNSSMRIFSNDDVTVGAWMLALDVNHEDSRALCDPRCTPTSIAVWDIPKCLGLCDPEEKLEELHKMDTCSKSPTLPPEDPDDR